MGLDPGLRWTGWGVARRVDAGFVAQGWGVIESAGERPQTLVALADGLERALDAHEPDAVAMERAFVHANAAMALRLGEARGVCLALCARRGLAVAELAPASVKRALTGSGRADKAQVARMVSVLIGDALEGAPSHASDALACALARAMEPASAPARALPA